MKAVYLILKKNEIHLEKKSAITTFIFKCIWISELFRTPLTTIITNVLLIICNSFAIKYDRCTDQSKHWDWSVKGINNQHRWLPEKDNAIGQCNNLFNAIEVTTRMLLGITWKKLHENISNLLPSDRLLSNDWPILKTPILPTSV